MAVTAASTVDRGVRIPPPLRALACVFARIRGWFFQVYPLHIVGTSCSMPSAPHILWIDAVRFRAFSCVFAALSICRDVMCSPSLPAQADSAVSGHSGEHAKRLRLAQSAELRHFTSCYPPVSVQVVQYHLVLLNPVKSLGSDIARSDTQRLIDCRTEVVHASPLLAPSFHNATLVQSFKRGATMGSSSLRKTTGKRGVNATLVTKVVQHEKIVEG